MRNANHSKQLKMNEQMCYLLHRMAMPGIKKRITLAKEPVKITTDSVLLTYYLDGNMRFMTFNKNEEGAVILYQRDIIQDYDGIGRNLKMYRKKIHCHEGRDGTPLMMESQQEFTWEDIKGLHGYELIDIVANWEYELTGKIAGFIPYRPKAKLRAIEPLRLHPVPGQSKVIEFNHFKAA